MNRLQKKCVIATAGIHLLLFIIFIFGPGFFNRQPKNDDNQVLDVIPANLVDAAINSGVQNATPPPPLPPQPVQPAPQPRAVEPPAPAPVPSVQTLTEKLEALFRSLPPTPSPEATPPPKPSKPKPDIQINTQLVKRTAPKDSPHPDTAQNQREVNNTLRNLNHQLSSSTKVDVPGTSDASMANYATVVKSIYERTLLTQLPGAVAHDNENTQVSITIASDGTVISSHIVSPSGDSTWDDAVQHTLDQVTFIAPFPEGATEKERHYTINFNPQVERSLQ